MHSIAVRASAGSIFAGGRGKTELIASELGKLFDHLLAPLGVERRPSSVPDAIALYRAARDRAEVRFGIVVDGELEHVASLVFKGLSGT